MASCGLGDAGGILELALFGHLDGLAINVQRLLPVGIGRGGLGQRHGFVEVVDLRVAAGGRQDLPPQQDQLLLEGAADLDALGDDLQDAVRHFRLLRAGRFAGRGQHGLRHVQGDALVTLGLLQPAIVLQPGRGLGKELLRLLLLHDHQAKTLDLREQAVPGPWRDHVPWARGRWRAPRHRCPRPSIDRPTPRPFCRATCGRRARSRCRDSAGTGRRRPGPPFSAPPCARHSWDPETSGPDSSRSAPVGTGPRADWFPIAGGLPPRRDPLAGRAVWRAPATRPAAPETSFATAGTSRARRSGPSRASATSFSYCSLFFGPRAFAERSDSRACFMTKSAHEAMAVMASGWFDRSLMNFARYFCDSAINAS